MPKLPNQAHRNILGMRVDATSYQGATERIVQLAKGRISTYVCVANVHMTMEAYDSPEFRRIVNDAELVTPDGMPLVWALRAFGIPAATRVRGADLVGHLAEAAARADLAIAVYGGTPDTLTSFTEALRSRFPGLNITCTISPPFRELTREEDEEFTSRINASGAHIVFVGLGCPRQERWMASHKGRLQAVMVGIGAALDFHAGRIREAPACLQTLGLEWLFRLLMEPRRLWWRYAKHNPRFMVLLMQQLLGLRSFG